MSVQWEIDALEFGNCNCGYACPCQFNALPTHGDCRAIGFFRVDRGRFGDVRLDGLKMAMVVSWPGAVHEGGGTMQPVIDVTADEAQRDALLSILTGKETDDMATVFSVYSAMCDTIHDPIYTEINIEADMEARNAKCEAVGVATGRVSPFSTRSPGMNIGLESLCQTASSFTRTKSDAVGHLRKGPCQ